ncbi:MAG: OmpA family protein [Selenomonas sp.]|nr:OmpA family protein [Selenomonas sp.]
MRQRNPWVSISDLLSSVVLILLLLFVMASIVPRYTQEAQRRDMMDQIEQALQEYEENGQIKVHPDTGMLEFTSVTFNSGSAEVTPQTMQVVADLSEKLKSYMDENANMEILIEGHTDPAAISQVINKGGYFSDNIQLSTLRAANVRSALLKYLGNGYARRIGVAGYGETRLKNNEDPLAAENRRIEIRILWNGNKEGGI